MTKLRRNSKFVSREHGNLSTIPIGGGRILNIRNKFRSVLQMRVYAALAGMGGHTAGKGV